VLSKFSRHAIINLHLKSIDESKPYPEEWMRKVVDLLYMYDSQEHVYFMGSPDVMITALKLAPEIPRCMAHLTSDPWGIVERAIKYQCCKVQLFAPWYNQEMIDKAHKNNILCNLFYCDDPETINDLFAMKIDTILTNNYVAVSAASQVK
jgi:glycerophosphoryl diester phosphodiesterase